MNRTDTTAGMLCHITERTLATVAIMAMLKSRKKSEYTRQISIAQKAMDWIIENGIGPSAYDSRVSDVIHFHNGNVQAWADQYDIKKKEAK